jgi:hypothetical protein
MITTHVCLSAYICEAVVLRTTYRHETKSSMSHSGTAIEIKAGPLRDVLLNRSSYTFDIYEMGLYPPVMMTKETPPSHTTATRKVSTQQLQPIAGSAQLGAARHAAVDICLFDSLPIPNQHVRSGFTAPLKHT